MLTELFIVKASLFLLALFTLSFLFYKRYGSDDKINAQLKHNISLLRQEKLLMHTDKKLQKKRHKLLKKMKFSDVNQKQLLNKSKKLGIPAGEILLAAKIQMSCK